MSVPKPPTREEQIQALAATVKDFGDGYFLVDASSGDGWKYLCNPSKNTCDCIDHRRKRVAHPSYQCKHLAAVALFLKVRPKAPPTIKQNLFSMEQHLKRIEAQSIKARAHLAFLEETPKGLAFW